MSRKRRHILWAIGVLGTVSVAWAQEGPNPADLKRMYDDVVAQLKGAQDRKNQLASENDKLQKRLDDMEKRLKTLEARNAELERDATTYAEKTYQLRATRAAWTAFLKDHPDTKTRWERFLQSDSNSDVEVTPPATWLNRNWPLREG